MSTLANAVRRPRDLLASAAARSRRHTTSVWVCRSAVARPSCDAPRRAIGQGRTFVLPDDIKDLACRSWGTGSSSSPKPCSPVSRSSESLTICWLRWLRPPQTRLTEGTSRHGTQGNSSREPRAGRMPRPETRAARHSPRWADRARRQGARLVGRRVGRRRAQGRAGNRSGRRRAALDHADRMDRAGHQRLAWLVGWALGWAEPATWLPSDSFSSCCPGCSRSGG